VSKSWTRRTVSLTAIFATLGVGFGASADASFGPKVGTQAPLVEALKDQSGKLRQLQDLAGPKGAVLMFFRTTDWCPYCQVQLIAMNAGAAAIEQQGYKIVGVSYDDPSVAMAFTQRRNITYALLSDPKSVVIDRWKLRDPQYPAGNRAFGVPRPIIFVIDRKGVIRASLAEETYKARPPVDEVLRAIAAIR
jgi:peroxiredoxin